MTSFEPSVAALALALRASGLKLVTAESCTGGMIAAACTAVAGSSQWFERGFVTYSNAAKTDSLGVDAGLIDAQSAVSEAVARAMVEGALARSLADLAVAVTGIAGPGGGSNDKPVGTVWLATARRDGGTRAELLRLNGDRSAIREQTVVRALQALLARVLPGERGA